MEYRFTKKERLKSKKTITQLFKEGKSLSLHPFHMVYLKTEFPDATPVQLAVSVSKRRFKKAVTRNRIKRLLREAYRKNKQLLDKCLPSQYAIMIIYTAGEIYSHDILNTKMKQLLTTFSEQTP